MIATRNFAIFGGSFDPIHNGHLHLIRKVIETGKFSKVIVVPAGDPWQKKPIADKSDRFSMAQLALEGFEVDIEDFEIKRTEPSYAIDTISFLKTKYPETSFTWIVGSDALSNLQTWRDIDRLAKEITFLVVMRPGHPVDPAAVHPGVMWSEIEISALDISATEIRGALSAGRDVKQWVPEKVLSFIKEKGLYGSA